MEQNQNYAYFEQECYLLKNVAFLIKNYHLKKTEQLQQITKLQNLSI